MRVASASFCAPCQLDGRRLDPFDRPEDDLTVERVDDDRLARVELLPEDLLRERILDEALDRTTQRPGTERRVVTLLGEQQLGVVGELEPDALGLELVLHPLDLEV